MLPPCDCIEKIENNFMKGPTFKNQMTRFGGIGNSFFSVIEKKGTSDVGQKWVMMKLEYNLTMCHTPTFFSLTLILTIAPPSDIGVPSADATKI